MMLTWWVGDRTRDTGYLFLRDLESRLANRIQLTSDGHGAYLEAMDAAFGGDVDFAQLVKIYRETAHAPGQLQPCDCIGAKKKVVTGDPDADHISTSHVERANLTMPMSMPRFTRLTNAFSKKFENHYHSLALYFCWYNWMRKHKSIRHYSSYRRRSYQQRDDDGRSRSANRQPPDGRSVGYASGHVG